MSADNVIPFPNQPTRKVGHITRLAALGSTSLSTSEVFPGRESLAIEGESGEWTLIEASRKDMHHLKDTVETLTGYRPQSDSFFR
jgi:hypothetical protein